MSVMLSIAKAILPSGFTIHRNPPKGVKRPRKKRAPAQVAVPAEGGKA